MFVWYSHVLVFINPVAFDSSTLAISLYFLYHSYMFGQFVFQKMYMCEWIPLTF